jgi:AcrR family transcriptional regulator
MTDSIDQSPATGSRRRGPALERAIFDAVWELLAESGYEQLSMAAVATRAGTSKPVLYRRWANRAELVIATLREKVPAPDPPSADQGSLRADLLAMLRPLAHRLVGTPPNAVRSLRTAMINDPELIAAMRTQMDLVDLGPAMTRVLARAARRGEVSGRPVGSRVLRLPLDLVRTESLRSVPVPDQVIVEIVDQILLPLLAAL